jgi:c(7)-type cytochrome triheme protein
MNRRRQSAAVVLFLTTLLVVCLGSRQVAAKQEPASAKTPAPSAAPAPAEETFHLHGKHVKEMGFDCSTCHLPVKEGSAKLQRPGHEQCITCHQEAFGENLNPKVCAQCHTEFPPTSAEQLLPFPKFKGKQPLLVDFSHAKHVDPHARTNANGMRADCTFCHTIDAKGTFSTGHEQCASCHSKAGMKPSMAANSTTQDCQGCHKPEAIEDPTLRADKTPVPQLVVAGKYPNIKFSHSAHFGYKGYDMNCTSCHRGVPASAHLATLDLPKMSDCGSCHAEKLASARRMDQCSTCHVNTETGVALASYSRLIKPAFHTESFRSQHSSEAGASGATCYMCHSNLSSSAAGKERCVSCHQSMKPASHTARWRDDVHGKFAAIDRQTCATCHTADTCSRCHNEVPRSHEPLAFFKGGAHARLAMLNERSCLTCHTFENTCAECHARNLR